MNVQQYKNAVAEIGCIVCISTGLGRTPAELHHPREDQGMSERASDWLVIPLCPEHHTGKTGFHGLGRRRFECMYGLSELDLIALTHQVVMGLVDKFSRCLP